MLNSGIVNVSFHFAFVDFVWGIFGFLHDFLCVSLHNMLAILEKSEYEPGRWLLVCHHATCASKTCFEGHKIVYITGIMLKKKRKLSISSVTSNCILRITANTLMKELSF